MSLMYYIKKHWILNTHALLWILVGSAVTVGWGWAFSNALTSLVSSHFQGFIIWMSILIGIFLIWCLQIYMQSKTLQIAIQAMNSSIRKDVTERIANYSYEDFTKHTEGTYVSWLTNDITTINHYGFHTLAVVASQLFTILFSISAIVYFHYSLIITLSGLVGLVLFTPRLFSDELNEKMNHMTQEDERFTTQIGDVMSGYSTLFVMNIRKYIVTNIFEGSTKLAKKKIAYSKSAGRMSASTNGVSLISQIIVIIQTGYLYSLKLVPIGAMSGTQYFAANIFANLTGLGANIIELKTVKPIFEKFEKIPLENNKGKKELDHFAQELVFENVNFRYPSNTDNILNELSFSIQMGEKVGLIGPSGSGKSTIMDLIVGKARNHEGLIRIDGFDYNKLNLESVRNRMIYLEQHPHIFNVSLRENIDLMRQATDKEIYQAIEKAGLTQYITSLPNGLSTVISTNGKNLSGGQRQRISLARGFLEEKSIVLFDEATSALDRASAELIENELISQKDLTIILVTHHLRDELRNQISQIIV